MKPWIKHALRGIALVILVVITAIASGIFWLLDTTSGFRWAVDVSEPYLPVTIQYADANGSLWQGVTFSRLTVTAKTNTLGFQEITATGLNLQWQPRKLLETQVSISRFHLNKLSIALVESPPPPTSDEPPALPKIHLPVNIVLNDLRVGDFQLSRAQQTLAQVNDISLRARAAGSKINIETFAAGFQGETYRLNGKLDFAPRWQIALNLPSHHVATQGSCVTEQPLECDLLLSWEDFSHPQIPQVESPNGDFKIHLTTQIVQAEGQTDIVTSAGDFHLVVDSFTDLTNSSSELKELQVTPASGGELQGSAQVNWRDGVRAQAQLQLNELNLQAWLGDKIDVAKITARLDADVGYKEELKDGKITLQIANLDLGKKPLKGDVIAQLQGQKISLEKLRLQNDVNELKASGEYGIDNQAIKLDLDFNAGNLNTIAEALNGSGHLVGNIAGKATAPDAQFTLNAQNLRFADTEIGKANMALIAKNLQLAAPEKIQLQKLDLVAEQLATAGNGITRIEFSASGSLPKHRATLSVSGIPGDLNLETLAMTGGITAGNTSAGYTLDTAIWDIQLQQLNISTGLRFGQWKLRQTVPIQLSQARVALNDFCLEQAQAQLCLDTVELLDQRDLTVATHVNGIYFDREKTLFKQYLQRLPTTWQTEGELRGKANIEATLANFAPRTFSIESAFNLVDASIHYRNEDEPNLDLPIEKTFVRIDGNQDVVNIDAGAVIDKRQQLRVAGTVKSALEKQPAIDITIDGALDTLAYIQPFVPTIAELEGKTRIDLHYQQNTENVDALVTGKVSLSEFGFILPQTGSRLRNWNIDIDAAKTSIDLRGKGAVGNGDMTLQGDIKPTDSGRFPFAARIKIDGEQLQLVDQPDRRFTASPHLQLEGEDLRWHLGGSVKISDSFMELKELPKSASSVSEDAVIYGEEPIEKPSPLVFTSDLKIIAGDNIRFEGFGLKTQIRGDLNFNLDASGRQQLQGSLMLPSGQYKSYGQDLKIEHGQIVFTGSMDNPNLDVRAARTIERPQATGLNTQIKAGIWLYGTAKHPKTQLYSTPSMSESDVLSYMLTGKPMSDVGKGEDGQAEAAALSMALAQALPTLQRIGGELGLTDITIDSDSSTGSSSVGAGKQVSDKLYVKYQYGLVGAVGRFILEYSLTQQLKIEAASGKVDSVDLTYTWDSKLPSATDDKKKADKSDERDKD
ncbi:conserved hypothetical protein [Teredinibacter turnerae T7901]|uniref:Translocation and assembly module TamB C-terminal domain-containing protein n=1 Tax=Teredinibacter turnerae (strain ATCC 39867 / T7901) TaxID=377629 RepID=C5BRL6_TERTT|nr:translocation/assembly module TamB domain-containing protein [Teredinibacter turnerae]ACR11657.1 conserved hypothetical protein [Teredinibacter turnerae T7901]